MPGGLCGLWRDLHRDIHCLAGSGGTYPATGLRLARGRTVRDWRDHHLAGTAFYPLVKGKISGEYVGISLVCSRL